MELMMDDIVYVRFDVIFDISCSFLYFYHNSSDKTQPLEYVYKMDESSGHHHIPEQADSTDEIIPDAQSSPARKRRRVIYSSENTFENRTEALAFVEKEKCWSMMKSTQTKVGVKTFFRCNKVKARGKQCMATIYLLFDITSARVFLFRCKHDHNCNHIVSKANMKLTPELRQAIESLCAQRQKPMQILKSLTQLGKPTPKLRTIKYVASQWRQRTAVISLPESSDSMNVINTDTQSSSARKRGGWYEYIWENTFENRKKALAFVANENCWGIRRTTETLEGVKKYFRCNKVKARGEQCIASIYLLFDATSARVLLFRCKDKHNCELINNKAHIKLTTELQEAIESLCAQRKKPRKILQSLTQLGKPTPNLNQINDVMAQWKQRSQTISISTISRSMLRKFLNEHTNVPLQDDELYAQYDACTDATYFRFFITSKSLIQNACCVDIFQADSTHKLLWQGLLVIVVGTTDANKQFCPIGICMCTDEQQSDYEFLFKSIKKCATELIGCEVSPLILVCDTSKAIINAFRAVYGADLKIIMCSAHMLSGVYKKLNLVKNNHIREPIIADIKFLQRIATETDFKNALNLFLKKWSDQVDFLLYFKQEWIDEHPNWYKGASPRTPSTNNALEATKKKLKDEFTFRQSLSLSEFISMMKNIIGQYSRLCSTHRKLIENPSITDNMWTATYHWTCQQSLVLPTISIDGQLIVPIKSSQYDENVPSLDTHCDNFDDFKIRYDNKWFVTLYHPETKWIKSLCTCPIFLKEYICKHVVGIAVRMKELQIPEDFVSVPIERKRKPGRPPKARTS